MTVGELFETCQFHLRRQDFNKQDFYRLLNMFLKEALKKINFVSLIKTTRLEPTNQWCVALPPDFFDDASLLVVGKNTRLTLPLETRLSINDFLLFIGTNDMEYLRRTLVPSIPMVYIFARPIDVFKNLTPADIPETLQSARCIITYPPIDYNKYMFSLDYYPSIPEEINDDYDTHPVLDAYPEWVTYEMLWRVFTAFGNYDAANVYKAIAAEKFIEVKGMESRRVLTPAQTLHLTTPYVRRKPSLRAPEPVEGRQVIKEVKVD